MTVSIIIPAYNCAPYLAATLNSVSEQTERDLDIVVVDDGSTDATLAIARNAAAADRRIRVYTQPNMGTPSGARNHGIREANGEFITFLDGDDLYHPEKIARQLAAFARCPELDVVFADVIRFENDLDAATNERGLAKLGYLEKTAAFMVRHSDTLYLCERNFYNFMSTQITAVNTQTIMIRRELLNQESLPFREDWPVGEDIDLWFRLALRARLGYLDEPLAYYRQRPASLMSDDERALVGFIRAHSANLERGRDVLSDEEKYAIKRRLARQKFNLGYLYFRRQRMIEARAAYAMIRDYDRSQYSWLANLKTYVPIPLLRLWWRR